MAITGEAFGRLIGPPVANASGVPISMRGWNAITFITFEEDGTTTATFTQHTSDAAGAADTESNLAVITRFHKLPGNGSAGATEITQAAANTASIATDATNDSMVITIRADQLADDNDYVECTVDGGSVCRDPSRSASSDRPHRVQRCERSPGMRQSALHECEECGTPYPWDLDQCPNCGAPTPTADDAGDDDSGDAVDPLAFDDPEDVDDHDEI